ncbi:MAG: inosine/xanthosine triphosphatase [Acidobacteriota bacterium]|jgi:non-canonical (house-cleaning) NTP pyrophosphatase|nr:inosine/xanthosine triphosphatase [Acidobacteriota bacterium]MDT7806472.1 inosine/xanthosine triphosphatase [Acidobacteriota bacterium]
MLIALGSARSAKIMALRAACARIAEADRRWKHAELVARSVEETGAPRMPLNDTQLMRGARGRADAMRELLLGEGGRADFYVGLEGGFHSITFEGERRTFLHGWAYVSDDSGRGYFGHAPAVTVPLSIVARVERTGRELGEVIDEVAGEHDVRSRQGAWGVLSRGLLTRAMSFETALVAAFAPFYNARLYK